MAALTIGSLFSGYGGLDLAAEQFFGATTAWVSDIDKGACKILAHRYPNIPNLGDVTRIDWANVQPVNILVGGSPCQDLSNAGRRAGMVDGTRSNLWVQMREAIATLRPDYIIWENVRGAYSTRASSGMESDPGLLGGHDTSKPALRALGRVLGDLADLGYDAQWCGLPASGVGACHDRFRVFVWAVAADADRSRLGEHGWPVTVRPEQSAVEHAGGDVGRLSLLPTPGANLGERGPQDPMERRAGGHSVSIQDVVHALLPTPRATDGTKGGPNQRGSSGDLPCHRLPVRRTVRRLHLSSTIN